LPSSPHWAPRTIVATPFFNSDIIRMRKTNTNKNPVLCGPLNSFFQKRSLKKKKKKKIE
jgi:hypothetical protein